MRFKDLELSRGDMMNAIDDACRRLKERYISQGYLMVYDLQAEFLNITLSSDIVMAANEISNITGCSEAEAVNFIIERAVIDDVKRFARKRKAGDANGKS